MNSRALELKSRIQKLQFENQITNIINRAMETYPTTEHLLDVLRKKSDAITEMELKMDELWEMYHRKCQQEQEDSTKPLPL